MQHARLSHGSIIPEQRQREELRFILRRYDLFPHGVTAKPRFVQRDRASPVTVHLPNIEYTQGKFINSKSRGPLAYMQGTCNETTIPEETLKL